MSEPTEVTDTAEEQTQPADLGGPSPHFVAAREKLGLTQKEVADKLFLTTTFIKYIDEGEFDKIPKPAFIKGYLRSYARVVELSGDEMVALYEAALTAGEPEAEIRGVTEESVGTAAITGPVLQTGLIGLAGLALIVGIVWWAGSSDEEPAPPVVTSPSLPGPTVEESTPAFDYVLDDVEPEMATEEETPEPESSTLQFEDEAISSTDDFDAVEDTVQDVVEEGAEAAFDIAEDVEDEVVEQVEEVAVPATIDDVKIERLLDNGRSYITVDAGGFDQVELTFTDECWVEIMDGQIGNVYNDLNRDNDVLTVYGTAPFEILLGKATGVEMIYNGRPFDLEPYVNQDKTAKLVISE